MTSLKLNQLKIELARVRRMSLQASRQNDYFRMAHLTVEAAHINQAISHVLDDLAVAAL